MFGLNQRSPLIKFLSSLLLIILFGWGLWGCSDSLEASSPIPKSSPVPVSTDKLTEVAPPTAIQELKEILAQYNPQVTILSPKPQQMFSETSVAVELQVEGYPLFKEESLELGPHVELLVDNEPSQAIYDLDEPIILEDLAPGTHTIRAFASRPWYESFKNEGAYAQVTFSVFTETEDNAPSSSVPLLTYSRPQGSYGTEPIMLDFYLTNAPLHFVAQSDPDDDIVDWRVKATINGESFLIDTWQPIYLKGFEPGENWVQLEFIDEQGQEVSNIFNDTVRVISYQPDGQDTLSKLTRGELSVDIGRSLVDANYTYIEETATSEENVVPETIETEESSEILEETQESATEPANIPSSPTITEEKENLEPEALDEFPQEIETPDEPINDSTETTTLEESSEPAQVEETVNEDISKIENSLSLFTNTYLSAVTHWFRQLTTTLKQQNTVDILTLIKG
ncbi:hypothetical protein [Crocosphaera sp. Alani8]|uniref:hypothetical protein n=1 Tax=Crocosphaera sp. Alani8 TaxID=3038952 RepID=UPI00313B935C